MVGIILAAGCGTRFSEQGCCKPLLRVNGKPLIAYSLENLAALRVREIVIVVGKYGDEIRAAVGGAFRGVPVRCVAQPKPLGIMNALFQAAETVDDDAALQLSDEIFIGLRADAPGRFAEADFLCGYTVPENPRIICENYAIVCEGDRILHTVEKPREPVNERKGTGFCVFSRDCVALLRKKYTAASGAGDLCDFMNLLIADGKKGIAVHVAEEEININDPDMFAYAEQRLERVGHE